jgi:hypothetical protein
MKQSVASNKTNLMKYSRHMIKGLALVSIFSCQGPEGKIGPAGLNSLVTINDELAGANCANGGIKVESGLDSNADGLLLSNEVTQTGYICNGANGANSLTALTDEPAGNNCTTGGYKFQVGLDLNRNLILDPTEVEATKYICSVRLDKLERLEVGPSHVGNNSTDWVLSLESTNQLIKFNKLDYANVDSITFVASLVNSEPINHIAGINHAYADLFNVTDNVSVNNSQVQSTSSDYIFVESRNIYHDLPNGEITLGVRLKSESSNFVVTFGLRSYLFIYKH